MSADLVLDRFAGPGGWDTGLRLAGYTGQLVGVEGDLDACRTATAAGHARVCADVRAFPLEHLRGRVVGCIESPPCPTWSAAGAGAGKVDLPNVVRLIDDHAAGRAPGAYAWADERSALTAEPMRSAVVLRPRWIALEQVPPVLVVWQHIAARLRGLGYWAWCGVLGAEEYGVPQTRRRAILVASLDGPVGPPAPTHQGYRSGRDPLTEPDLFGDPLPAPVSMAEALGWDGVDRPARTVCGDRSPRWAYGAGNSYATGWTLPEIVMRSNYGTDGVADVRAEREQSEPSVTITGRPPQWTMRNGNQANACERDLDEPAGTLFFGQRANAVEWRLRVNDTTNGTERASDEPAPTVFASRPGNLQWRVGTGNNSRQAGHTTEPYERDAEAPAPTLTGNVSRWQARPEDDRAQAVRVTVAEAGVLQSFPADYPWTGTKTAQYRQVGDAVPPLLAAAVLRPLLVRAGQVAA